MPIFTRTAALSATGTLIATQSSVSIYWAEMSVPDVNESRAVITWVAVNVPDAVVATQGTFSWAAMTVPDPVSNQVQAVFSWAEMSIPSIDVTTAKVTWLQFSIPDASGIKLGQSTLSGSGTLAASANIAGTQTRAKLTWLEFSIPDAVGPGQVRGLFSWAQAFFPIISTNQSTLSAVGTANATGHLIVGSQSRAKLTWLTFSFPQILNRQSTLSGNSNALATAFKAAGSAKLGVSAPNAVSNLTVQTRRIRRRSSQPLGATSTMVAVARKGGIFEPIGGMAKIASPIGILVSTVFAELDDVERVFASPTTVQATKTVTSASPIIASKDWEEL